MNACLKQLVLTCRLAHDASTKKSGWRARIGFLRLMPLAIWPVLALIRYEHDRSCLKWKHLETPSRRIPSFWLSTLTDIDYALVIRWDLGIAPGQSHGISAGLCKSG